MLPLRFPPADATTDAPASPCIRVCRLEGDDGLCSGCLRTRAEIAGWARLPEDERRRMMEGVLAERGRGRYAFL